MANLQNRNRLLPRRNMNPLPPLILVNNRDNNNELPPLQVNRNLPVFPPRQNAMGGAINHGILPRQNAMGPNDDLFGLNDMPQPENFARIKWHNDLWNARFVNFGNF